METPNFIGQLETQWGLLECGTARIAPNGPHFKGTAYYKSKLSEGWYIKLASAIDSLYKSNRNSLFFSAKASGRKRVVVGDAGQRLSWGDSDSQAEAIDWNSDASLRVIQDFAKMLTPMVDHLKTEGDSRSLADMKQTCLINLYAPDEGSGKIMYHHDQTQTNFGTIVSVTLCAPCGWRRWHLRNTITDTEYEECKRVQYTGRCAHHFERHEPRISTRSDTLATLRRCSENRAMEPHIPMDASRK